MMFKKLKVILVKPSKTFDVLQYTDIPTYVTLRWLYRQRYVSRNLKNCKAKIPRIKLTGRHWHPNASFFRNLPLPLQLKLMMSFPPQLYSHLSQEKNAPRLNPRPQSLNWDIKIDILIDTAKPHITSNLLDIDWTGSDSWGENWCNTPHIAIKRRDAFSSKRNP